MIKLKDKKNIIILFFILLFISLVILLIFLINNPKKENNISENNNESNNINLNVVNSEHNNIGENETSNIIYNEINSTVTTNKEIQNDDSIEVLGGKLNESGITFDGNPIKYNQTISTKLNIAYMLKYNINHDIEIAKFEKDMSTYISKNKPKSTGLWIENQELLEGDPLGTDRFISILSQIGLDCSIDSNGFVQKSNSTVTISKYINEIIDSGKLVMIAFSPDYYAYIEDFDNKAHMTDTEDSFVSFEPYNNIYPYIITGKCEIEELEVILKQISNDVKK